MALLSSAFLTLALKIGCWRLLSLEIETAGPTTGMSAPYNYNFVMYIRVKNSSVNIGKMYFENT